MPRFMETHDEIKYWRDLYQSRHDECKMLYKALAQALIQCGGEITIDPLFSNFEFRSWKDIDGTRHFKVIPKP